MKLDMIKKEIFYISLWDLLPYYGGILCALKQCLIIGRRYSFEVELRVNFNVYIVFT